MLKKILLILLFFYILLRVAEKLDNTYYLNQEKGKCCLVEKKVDKNGFYYHYSIIDCDNNIEKNLNENRLLTEKQYPLNMCNYYDSKDIKFSKKLGSCRRVNHECLDFVNKKTCDKYDGMRWEPVPCNMPILYQNKIKTYQIGNITI